MNRLLQKDDSPQSFVSNFSVIFHDYMRQSNTGHCVKKHYKKTKKKTLHDTVFGIRRIIKNTILTIQVYVFSVLTKRKTLNLRLKYKHQNLRH